MGKRLYSEPPKFTCRHCGETKSVMVKKNRAGKPNGYLHTQKFCDRRCSNLFRGSECDGFIDKDGYRIISLGSREAGQRAEHIVVMEKKIGRRLLKGETVHHKNGIRHDNPESNLELWTSRHGKGQRVSDRVENAFAILKEHVPFFDIPVANDFILGALA